MPNLPENPDPDSDEPIVDVCAVNSDGDNIQNIETLQPLKTFIPDIEPFVDLDIARIRNQLIDQSLLDQQLLIVKEKIGSPDEFGFYDRIAAVLAEIRAEIHYLRTAYLKETRYQEADFDIAMPMLQGKPNYDEITVDMRTDITCGNWWKAEPDGRWAGPESVSSLVVPALSHGRYRIEINIVDEIKDGIIDGTSFTFNRQPIAFERVGRDLPAILTAEVEVLDTYRFPFWSLKFFFPQIVSPAQLGGVDQRTLAIRVRSVKFTKVNS